MKFNIITLGCKVNAYESQIMKELLLNNNFSYVDSESDADIVIVNTCSVTNNADSKCKKMIRGVRKNNQSCILVVCGCMAQNHQNELVDLDIDILIGNKDKSKIVELINNFKINKERITKFYDLMHTDFERMHIHKFSDMTRAYIKIQDGCNNYCSYCVIPYMRGDIRSKDFNETIEETKELVNNGHKEIILTGIHTGSYGRGTDHDLVDLINEMSKIEGLERIRVSSIEITEMNDKFFDMLKNNPKVCDHLHIPLQGGSDEILKSMHRKYNLKEYEDIINKIRSIRPMISITTDVIVGFPGETEEMFQQTIAFCKKMKYAKIHVFPYSRREGTYACKIDGHLDNSIKKERSRRLIEVSNELENNYNSLFIGKELNVLIEEYKDNMSIGHTSNYIKVCISKKLETNKDYKVIVNELYQESVKATLK